MQGDRVLSELLVTAGTAPVEVADLMDGQSAIGTGRCLVIRVVLVAEMRLLREALTSALTSQDDIEIVAALGWAEAIVPTALEHRPDVAVCDIDSSGFDGLATVAELHRRLPECRTVIVTDMQRRENLRRGLDAHVSGFMLKNARLQQLIEAVRTVASGGRVIDPELAFAVMDVAANPLTDRQLEILRQFAAGADPAEIAVQLALSHGTVRNYLASAVTKLGARNRMDAARIAADAGWL
jgi:two-component system response regulator DesR